MDDLARINQSYAEFLFSVKRDYVAAAKIWANDGSKKIEDVRA